MWSDNELDHLERRVDERFVGLDARLAKVSERLAGVEGRLNNIEKMQSIFVGATVTLLITVVVALLG